MFLTKDVQKLKTHTFMFSNFFLIIMLFMR